MINLFDNFENALKNTDNEDLIKYYFEFNIENEYKFKCKHNINHIENLYNLELEIENIIIYDGSNEEGHYFNLIKDNNSTNWYKINDEFIDNFEIKNQEKEAFGGIDEFNNIKNNNAYLLFYIKENDNNCNIYKKVCLNKIIDKSYNLIMEEDNIVGEKNGYDIFNETTKSDIIIDGNENIPYFQNNDIDKFMENFDNMRINDNSNSNINNIYKDSKNSKKNKEIISDILNNIKPKKRKKVSYDSIDIIKKDKSFDKKKKKLFIQNTKY